MNNTLFRSLPTLAGDHCSSCGCPLMNDMAVQFVDHKLGEVMVCEDCARKLVSQTTVVRQEERNAVSSC